MGLFSRYKKIIFIILFLAIVFLLGWLLWITFFRPAPTATLPGGTVAVSPGGLPIANEGQLSTGDTGGPGSLPRDEKGDILSKIETEKKRPGTIASGGDVEVETLTDSRVANPTTSDDGRIQYYNKDDGKFYKINNNGDRVPLSDKVFHQVQNVSWAPDKDKAVIEYPDGSKIMYDFRSEEQVTLPSHWEDFSFSPDSQQIASKSIGLDPDNRWLMISNADGSQAKAIEPIGTNSDSVYPSWSPSGQMVAMYTKGVDFDRQEVFFVGLNNENFKSTIIEGRGFQSQWSTDGDRLLYSVYHSRDDLKPRLWIVNATADTIGQSRQSFDLETWANKCTFATNTEIYCAVPDNLDKGAGLFPELGDRSEDSLYKIDLNTGTKQLIAVPNDSYNISQIVVSENQDYLYFTDKYDGLIHKVRLK